MTARGGEGAGRVAPEHVFDLSGGRLCLDLANTVSGHRATRPRERLGGYADLLSFSRQAGALSGEAAARLLEEAARRPGAAAAALERAVALREAIYRIFSAVAAGDRPSPDDLARLTATLAAAAARARIVETPAGFGWDWASDEPALDSMLGPVAESAVDLLVVEGGGAVRECAADDCSWLFVDTSRNRTRRWCDMRSCGNRAKARRHRMRRQAHGEARGGRGGAVTSRG